VEHVVSIEKSCIEVVDWKSARIVQRIRVDEGSGIRVLCARAGNIVVCVEGKGKGKSSVIVAMREVGREGVVPDDVGGSQEGLTKKIAFMGMNE
jgi:ribosomal protein L14